MHEYVTIAQPMHRQLHVQLGVNQVSGLRILWVKVSQ